MSTASTTAHPTHTGDTSKKKKTRKYHEYGHLPSELAKITKLPAELIREIIHTGRDGKPVPVKPELIEPPLF